MVPRLKQQQSLTLTLLGSPSKGCTTFSNGCALTEMTHATESNFPGRLHQHFEAGVSANSWWVLAAKFVPSDRITIADIRPGNTASIAVAARSGWKSGKQNGFEVWTNAEKRQRSEGDGPRRDIESVACRTAGDKTVSEHQGLVQWVLSLCVWLGHSSATCVNIMISLHFEPIF